MSQAIINGCGAGIPLAPKAEKGIMKNKRIEERQQAIRMLSDEALHERFWNLSQRIVEPLVALAQTHTTPSIERSVLLRAGISSLEAGQVVELAFKKGLLGVGAGNLVLRLAEKRKVSFETAARSLAANDGWEEVDNDA